MCACDNSDGQLELESRSRLELLVGASGELLVQLPLASQSNNSYGHISSRSISKSPSSVNTRLHCVLLARHKLQDCVSQASRNSSRASATASGSFDYFAATVWTPMGQFFSERPDSENFIGSKRTDEMSNCLRGLFVCQRNDCGEP